MREDMKGMIRMYSIHSTLRAGLAIAVAAVASFACASVQAAAATPPAVAAGVPVRRDFIDLGRAPGTTTIEISLVMRYRNEAEIDKLAAAQSDPRSPLFGRYLTNDEFNAYFAPAPQDYARAVEALARAGFHVDRTYANRTLVSASAP